MTCILGRNGVGKTSLLRAIFGLNPIRSGRIRWEDRDLGTGCRLISAPAPAWRWSRKGARSSRASRCGKTLRPASRVLPRSLRHIPDEIFALFPVLKDMLGRRGGDLSGGQQQQLAIARALIVRPRLLILDEPTEGIQPSIIKEIGRVIERLAERGDMAILLVEQYFEFARDLAAAYVVMQRGEVVLGGRQSDMDEAAARAYLTV